MTVARISKDFAFSASHQLAGLPDSHQCSRLHGHNYVFRIEIEGHVVDPGFVVDYAELGPIKSWIDDTLDHRHLNDVLDFNPTAENMAAATLDKVKQLLADAGHGNVSRLAVAVSETPKTWATVAEDIEVTDSRFTVKPRGNETWWRG